MWKVSSLRRSADSKTLELDKGINESIKADQLYYHSLVTVSSIDSKVAETETSQKYVEKNTEGRN